MALLLCTVAVVHGIKASYSITLSTQHLHEERTAVQSDRTLKPATLLLGISSCLRLLLRRLALLSSCPSSPCLHPGLLVCARSSLLASRSLRLSIPPLRKSPKGNKYRTGALTGPIALFPYRDCAETGRSHLLAAQQPSSPFGGLVFGLWPLLNFGLLRSDRSLVPSLALIPLVHGPSAIVGQQPALSNPSRLDYSQQHLQREQRSLAQHRIKHQASSIEHRRDSSALWEAVQTERRCARQLFARCILHLT